jgi:hypothetical protein
VTKPSPRPAAKHEEYDFEARLEALGKAIARRLNREMAQVPREEKRAWLVRWMIRKFGPGIIAAGLLVKEPPTKRPKKARATPARKKALRR